MIVSLFHCSKAPLFSLFHLSAPVLFFISGAIMKFADVPNYVSENTILLQLHLSGHIRKVM